MPSMEVCNMMLTEVAKGIEPDMNYGSVPAPSGAKCIAVDGEAGLAMTN